jgi:biopolymer transport protein ExbD
MRRLAKRNAEEADVDVTSFINLVIVLVPVLLMGMVLSKITVLDLKLPDILTNPAASQDEPPAQLEVIVRRDYFDINYPAGIRLARIEKTVSGQYDYPKLTLHLQEIKRQLAEKNIAKRDIYLLSEKTIDYQTLVQVMDVVRSYRAVLATSVVNAELFPEVSLGDAPVAVEQDPAVPEAGAQQ